MDVTIIFPDDNRVDAVFENLTIVTGESPAGGPVRPSPVHLFLAALGTCAGANLQAFFAHRKLSARNAKLVMRLDYDDQDYMIVKITNEVHVPADFPEKYRDALVRAVDACYVRKHLSTAPEFQTTLTVG